ncbi:hypothetical protein ACFP2T_17350 [Plantactinospora solaniradicis]|uniref:Uncharacterized protein n=1 Tax=Plantactinospora solaniradicis TaxID=1723736 RepID=A0ABW1K9R4_9ACTN
MCVSTGAATFSRTILYGGRRRHPRHGPIEVLGYQNTPTNLANGPNAMLLHIPGAGLSQRNFVPVGPHDDILTRMVDRVRPKSRAPASARLARPGTVQVFEHDVYTIVLASDPTLISTALSQVPPQRRPPVDPELLEFYRDVFPTHAVALCCFDNTRARRAKPLLVWYEPADPDRIVLPALDCHTGAVPDLDAPVRPDHWLLFGTDDAPPGWGTPVEYPSTLDPGLRDFLPDTVVGVEFTGEPLPNGDFAIAYQDLLDGALGRIERQRPAATR